jgi:hypothetical protein
MVRADDWLRQVRARLRLFWPCLLVCLLVWALGVPLLLVTDSGPGGSMVAAVLTALVGAQAAIVLAALAVDLWSARERRHRDRAWLLANAAATLDLHATLRNRLASLAEGAYRLVRPVLAPEHRVPPELVFADLERPPALREPADGLARAAYLEEVRRGQDGPFETASRQVESMTLSCRLVTAGPGPLDWANGRRDRLSVRPGDWARLRLTATTVEKLASDLVDPRLADLHAGVVRQVAVRIERDIADEVRVRASVRLAQPESSVLDQRRRRARENPFGWRFVRDCRVLTEQVELLVLEASGAAWAVDELVDRHEQGDLREPDEHDRRVVRLVSDVLASIRSLHQQLRELTVVLLEIAARELSAEELEDVSGRGRDPWERVHYQAMDRLWEFHVRCTADAPRLPGPPAR